MDSMILLHGDCLKLMESIPDKSIGCIICDLPYGQTQNKWDSQLPLDQLWIQYRRITKENAAIILFGNGMFTAELMMSNPKEWRYNLIWEKTLPVGFLNARRMPLRSHEDICIFYQKLPVYNPQMSHGHKRKTVSASARAKSGHSTNYGKFIEACTYDSTDRFPKSVWRFAQDKQRSALHPTQKPVALIEELIKTYTNAGDTVLDNCMGSGTTGIACRNLGRKFIGIELDKDYYEIARKRILEDI